MATSVRIMIFFIIFAAVAGCVKEKKQDFSVTVTGIVGTVSLNQPDNEIQVNAVLHAGDKIITAANSMATLLIPADSTVKVYEKTEFVILSHDKAATGSAADNTKLGVNSGKSMFVIEKLSKDSTLTITTPTATAAVRGTSFIVEVSGAATGAKKETTNVKVVHGAVYVEAKDKPQANSMVKDGEMIALAHDAVIEEKKSIPEKTLKALKEEENDLSRGIMRQSDSDRDTEKNDKKQEDKSLKTESPQPPPVLKTEAAIKEYYHKLEQVNLDDGSTLVGAVISQSPAYVRIHTASGIIMIPTSSIKNIVIR